MKKANSIANMMAAISVLILYFGLFSIGRYVVTFGTLFCVIYAMYGFIYIRSISLPLIFGVFFVIYPVLTFFLAYTPFGGVLRADVDQFSNSYLLWLLSIAILSLAFSQVKGIFPAHSFWLSLVIVAFMAVQTLGKALFGSLYGYEIVAPFIGVDVNRGYLYLSDMNSFRAIGLYYEPSMCGRVVATLCLMDYAISGRPLRNIIVFIIGVALSASLGMLVLGLILGLMLYLKSIRQLLPLAIGMAAVLITSSLIFSTRLTDQLGPQSSSYIRTIAPIESITWVFDNVPFGIPVGSAEGLAQRTGYSQKTGEAKITNGIYEFITYFGVIGIPILLTLILFVFINITRGKRERAASIAYLLLSTAISGSILSVQSSLLTAFFVGVMRHVASRRTPSRETRKDRLSSSPMRRHSSVASRT